MRFNPNLFAAEMAVRSAVVDREPAFDHEMPDDVYTNIASEYLGECVTNRRPMPPIVDAAEFIAETILEPTILVQGILHQGSKLVLGGGSKSFKTWTLLDLALSVASGLPWLGFETVKSKVIYLNFEIQSYAWQRRIQTVAKAKGVNIEPGMISLWNLRGHAADYKTILPRIAEEIAQKNIALVILDPIYKIYGDADENKAGDVAKLLNGLESLAVLTGAAIAFGAHFSKGNQAGKEAIDRISGSGVFARDPDSMLVFTKHQEEEAFTIEPILRNFSPVKPLAVRWNFPLFELAEELDPSKLKEVGGRRPEYDPNDILKLIPDGGISGKELCALAMQNGISERTFFRLRKTLENESKITFSKISGKWEKFGLFEGPSAKT